MQQITKHMSKKRINSINHNKPFNIVSQFYLVIPKIHVSLNGSLIHIFGINKLVIKPYYKVYCDLLIITYFTKSLFKDIY